MSDLPKYRKVVAVCPDANRGEAIYCDDGACFYCWPVGDNRRFHIEGTPVPGSQRASELNELAIKAYVPQWEQVARNLAQVLLSVYEDDQTFAHQCAAHGLKP
jgi:hypothetical protein